MNTFIKFIIITNVFSGLLFSCEANDFEKQYVTFYSQKGEGSNERIARKGILVKRKDAKATILMLHGYGKDKFDVGPFRLLFPNFNCLSFDFRAHGEYKEDQYSTIGYDEVYDVFAAVDFIKSQSDLKDKPIFIFAHSMGAATAIEAQSLDPNLFKAMFLDAPFSSSEEILRDVLKKMQFKIFGYKFNVPCSALLEKYAFNPYVQSVIKYFLKGSGSPKIKTFMKPIVPSDSVKNITIPCFFVICKNDEKISVDAVKKIFNNHKGFKRFWLTNGRSHCDSVFCNPEEYIQTATNFYNDVLSDKITQIEKELIIEDKNE